MRKRYKRYTREKRLRVNQWIRIPQVRVIDEDGSQLGIMETGRAQEMAKQKGLDLVEVGPSAKPPIVKVMDYGKYKYQKEKQKDKSERKNKQVSQEIKTVKIGFRTNEHDLGVRAVQADKFLKKGYRVTVSLVLRGREKGKAALGEEKLRKFPEFLQEPFEIESPPKRFPMGFTMTLKPAKQQKT